MCGARLKIMRSFVRNLSRPAEFCLVLLLGFGLTIGLQAWKLATSRPTTFTDGVILRGVILETIVLGAILQLGKIRGWSIATFGSRISWRGTGGGILLFIVTALALVVVGALANIVHPQPTRFTAAGLTVPAIILLSVINPVFEEVLEVGYFIHSLQAYGLWAAVPASALFRAFLHMYQGINGMIGIFVIGLIFGWAYSKWRQLWPLVVAHSLWDFFALLAATHPHTA
jgi:membrane protease YdiL (CAAX protease family)